MDVPYTSSESVETYAEDIHNGLFATERRLIDAYVPDQAKILDLGCGTGRTTIPLEDRGFDVVALDRSKPMIQKASSLPLETSFQIGDATALPFDDESFDCVLFSFNGIDYVSPKSERKKVFEEVRRVLVPGGVYLFSTHNSWLVLPHRLYNPFGYLLIIWFWLRNLWADRLLDAYRIDYLEIKNPVTHFVNPFEQMRTLRENGFEVLEVDGHHKGPLKWLDPWPYYAARKRP